MFDQQNPLSAAEAAERLPELHEVVTERPGTAVYISRQDRTRSAVLVDHAHYQLLLLKAELADQLGDSGAIRSG